MLRMLRRAVVLLAMGTATTLTGCGGETPAEPTADSPLSGSWVGDYNEHEIQLALIEHDGRVSGTGKYYIGATAHAITITGTATPSVSYTTAAEPEEDFTLTLSGDGVPTTSITGRTSRTTRDDGLFEVLPTYVSNALVGSVYMLFARP